MSTDTPRSAGWRGRLSGLALIVAFLVPIWFMVGALGTNWGWWDYSFGLGKMYFQWGQPVVFAAAGLSIIALIAGLAVSPRFRPTLVALFALLIVGLVGGRLAGMAAGGLALPPIHDIQTNWDDPIAFSDALMAVRDADGATNAVLDAPTIAEGADSRWPGLGGRLVSEVQEETEFDPATMEEPEHAPYPYSFDTLIVDGDLTQIADIAERVAITRGWEIVTSATATAAALEAQVEATETSTWFGFKDDVAIRLRSVEEGVAVDVRSTSRVGLSDLGANAKRVDAYIRDFQRAVNASAGAPQSG